MPNGAQFLVDGVSVCVKADYIAFVSRLLLLSMCMLVL